MPLILGTNSIKDTGFNVANSLRFNSGSSDYLSRSTGVTTTNTKFTLSFWIKLCDIANYQSILEVYKSANERVDCGFNLDNSNQPRFFIQEYTGSYIYRKIFTRVLRDVSAWIHYVVKFDSSESEANRLRVYINGVEETATDQANLPGSSATSIISVGTQHIGYSQNNSGHHLNGYLAEFVLIEGTDYDPTSFGEFNSDSPTIWQPINVSGLTFGTNGFYLDFEDSSALGKDVSGNSNNFTVNNLTSVDQSTDTCTNNFATLNPLYKQDHAFSEGNLGYTSSASDWDSAPATIGVSSGKWYVEMKITGTASGVTRSVLGLCDERDANLTAESEFGLTSSIVGDNVGYSNGDVHKNNSADSGSFASFGINDILGMYVDLDNGKVYFSKNGEMQNSGDPTSGSTGTGAISITTGQTYIFGATGYGGGASQMNFGSPPYAVSSGNADPNGYGNFEYGTQNYYALNTKNLAEFG